MVRTIPRCPDQLEYVEIGGGLGGVNWPGVENNQNLYKTIENHTKGKKTIENKKRRENHTNLQKAIESFCLSHSKLHRAIVNPSGLQ